MKLGMHIGTLLGPFIPSIRPPSGYIRYSITALSVCIYFATYPAYFRLPASFRHQATAALLFSFPGTLTRYVLSIELNPRYKALPLGTLAANSLGTGLLAMFHALQGLPDRRSPNACAVLQGLADGYCGCLTTVSTFIVEVNALTTGKKWLYSTITLVIGQILMLVILGSSLWAGGVVAQGTCVYAR